MAKAAKSNKRAKGGKKAAKRTKKKGKASPKAKTARARPTKGRTTQAPAGERRLVENVNVPGYKTTVDAARYDAMHRTLLDVIPQGPPGITQAEMMAAARKNAPRTHFPGGNKTEWWAKTVHLDQEAKGTMKRSDTRPLRWWRVD